MDIQFKETFEKKYILTNTLNKLFNDPEVWDKIKALKNNNQIPERITSIEELVTSITESFIYLRLIIELNQNKILY
jgi:hypothetical protein